MVAKVLLILALLCLALYGDESLSRLLERYRSAPPTGTLCDRIGIAYTTSGDLEEAAKFFREALRIEPDLLSAQKNLGTVLWFLDRRFESEKQFLKVSKRAPLDPVAQLYLGLAAYDRKEYGTAEVHLEAAGTLASANPEVFPILIETYLASRQPANVIRLLEHSAISGTRDAKVWMWLGKAYDQQNRPQDAYRALNNAIDLGQDTDDPYVALAAFAAEHGNRTFARETIDRGLGRCPKSVSLILEAGILWALDGDFEKAEKVFSIAYELAPNSSVPLLAMGVAQLQAGKASESASAFQKAAAIDPNDYRAEYLYATALSRTTSQGDASEKNKIEVALLEAVSLNPKHLRSRVALGQLYISEHREEAAVPQFLAALSIDPNEAGALYQLSLVRRRQGKLGEAMQLMERFRTSKEKSLQSDNELVQILKTVR